MSKTMAAIGQLLNLWIQGEKQWINSNFQRWNTSALTFVPFGVAVDEFQHICYAHPELTPKERTYQWHLLEEKYIPWRRYENDAFMERGGYW